MKQEEKIKEEFNQWKFLPLYFIPDEIKYLIENKSSITIHEYKQCLEIFRNDVNFRVLRNDKIIFIKKNKIPDGLFMCSGCGLVWDGCAQCPCWMERDVLPYIIHD